MAEFTVVSGLWVAYSVAALGLVALVLRARPITTGNLALVALLVHQAVTSALSVVYNTSDDLAIAGTALSLNIPAFLLWSPLVWLAGPLLLGQGPGASRIRVLGIVGAAPNVLLLIAWFVQPTLVFDGVQLTELAAAGLFLVFLGFAFSVAVLAREALTTPLPVRQGQYALLAAAFTVEGAYHAAQNSAKIAGSFDFHGAAAAGPLLSFLSIAPLVAFLAIAAWSGRFAFRDADPQRQRWARILVACIGASVLTGILAAPLTPQNEYVEPTGAIHALWDLVALALIVYAGMRFQLFSLERRAKQSVAVTAAVALGFVAFNAAQEMTEQLLPDAPLLGGLFQQLEGVVGGSASGVVAALMVGAISIPIGKAGQGFARKLFPHVVPTEDYEEHRKREIYRAALEGAFADGIATPREAASLRHLRVALGISDAEHDRLEFEVRQLLHEVDSGMDRATEVERIRDGATARVAAPIAAPAPVAHPEEVAVAQSPGRTIRGDPMEGMGVPMAAPPAATAAAAPVESPPAPPVRAPPPPAPAAPPARPAQSFQVMRKPAAAQPARPAVPARPAPTAMPARPLAARPLPPPAAPSKAQVLPRPAAPARPAAAPATARPPQGRAPPAPPAAVQARKPRPPPG